MTFKTYHMYHMDSPLHGNAAFSCARLPPTPPKQRPSGFPLTFFNNIMKVKDFDFLSHLKWMTRPMDSPRQVPCLE